MQAHCEPTRFVLMLVTLRTRPVRIGAVALFFGLVLAVSAQRRIAEIDFNDDFGDRLENGDVVDGDELLRRLLLADDISTPEMPRQTAVISWITPGLHLPAPLVPALPPHSTRAPPRGPFSL